MAKRKSNPKRFDLQERLINFSVRIIQVAEALPNTKTGNHVRGQLLRCGTSPAPNYAEAQSAESRSDFIHKIKIVLKELRETKVWLLTILRTSLITPPSRLQPLIQECDELISIFVQSVKTADKHREQ
jgi:four helix bundle protein